MTATPLTPPSSMGRAPAAHPFRRLMRNPLGLGSLAVLGILVLVALLAPWLAPFDPNASRVELTNAPSFSTDYVLGGDAAGRDVLSRLIWATRSTLLASVIVLAVSVVLGVVGGLLGGFYGGLVDGVGSWASNAILALPGVVLLIALYSVIGPNILLAMAMYGVLVAPVFYRLVRGVVAGVRRELYIDAAQVSGLGDMRIIFRHVLRAVRSPVIIQSAFILGAAVGIQAALEFLGLGSPGEPSWGGMLELAFRNLYVSTSGVVWPAVVVTVTVLAFVLLGNALRDALDPGSKLVVPPRKQRSALREHHGAQPSPVLHETVSPAGASASLLRVRDLRLGYLAPVAGFQEVVQGVTFDVFKGEVLGLVGESGSGKSQTAFALLGLLPKSAVVVGGSVQFDGEEILDRPSALRKVRGARIAYVPQEPMTNLDPTMTIGKQLVHGLRAVRPVSARDARHRLIELLRRVGIVDAEAVFGKYPHEISGGMAQRVLITGAIAAEPDLIIADEPTTALDVTVQADVLDLLRELRDERGLGVVLVTHNLGVIADVCDRVAVMRHGTLVETAPVESFMGGPEHEYSRELLRAAAELV